MHLFGAGVLAGVLRIGGIVAVVVRVRGIGVAVPVPVLVVVGVLGIRLPVAVIVGIIVVRNAVIVVVRIVRTGKAIAVVIVAVVKRNLAFLVGAGSGSIRDILSLRCGGSGPRSGRRPAGGPD
jgi:hypothetical protein